MIEFIESPQVSLNVNSEIRLEHCDQKVRDRFSNFCITEQVD
ncbi:protein of unknown function [Petrocella atlantisensis]|uniref:Uncharacterized protein n=1 Tax=Petrocella atlantisensis TaxID=2173034 RepID=A0A3P7NU61_9FIRM|nr:protein of unknown function [Petrocella atlantisensis]